MATTYVVASLHAKLRALQCNQGGWGFQADQQAMEPTCLSILALRNDRSPDVESALRAVKNFLKPGDVVLLKASRASRLERIAETLKSENRELK